MREVHEQHQNVAMHEALAVTPQSPPARTATRIYERQRDFQRDVRYRKRQGWKLVNAQHQRVNLPLDKIRSSSPGSLLHESNTRIVAHYVCVAPEMSRLRATLLVSAIGETSYQTRLAASGWLTRLAHSIHPPILPE